MKQGAYCTATFRDYRKVSAPDGAEFEYVDAVTELSDYASVVEHLKAVYDANATRMADENGNRPVGDRDDRTSLGGFCVRLTNRHGGEIEFALGRQYCLLQRLRPEPFARYRNGPDSDDLLDFYLHGWNHTQFFLHELAPREECLQHLENWLESGFFPENAV